MAARCATPRRSPASPARASRSTAGGSAGTVTPVLAGRRRGAGSRRLRSLRRRLGTLVSLGLEPRDQLLERRARDDRVELGAVVGDEAHALDVHVVGAPALALREHLVVHGHLGALPRDDPRAHRDEIAVRDLAGVEDALARVALDLGDVGALEEIAEEPDELVALGRRARRPVTAERALRDRGEVEDLVGDRPDGGAALGRPAVLPELGVLEHLQHVIHALVELIGGGPRPPAPGRGERGARGGPRRGSGPGHSMATSYT